MKIKLTFLAILLSTSMIFPEHSLAQKSSLGKLFGYLGSTKAIYWFDKHIQNFLQKQILHRMIPYGDELASEEYQTWGHEVQTAVGIPKEFQVPIKNLSPQNPIIKYIGALAETDGIYINKEKLDQATVGNKRCLLFHEATHKKYNDLSVGQILELLLFFPSVIGTYAILKKIDKIYSKPWYIRWGIILSVWMATNALSGRKFQKFIERRADVEGCYACACHLCVKDLAVRRKELFEEHYNPLKGNGYLFHDELQIIAQELEQEGKICEYHKNN